MVTSVPLRFVFMEAMQYPPSFTVNATCLPEPPWLSPGRDAADRGFLTGHHQEQAIQGLAGDIALQAEVLVVHDSEGACLCDDCFILAGQLHLARRLVDNREKLLRQLVRGGTAEIFRR